MKLKSLIASALLMTSLTASAFDITYDISFEIEDAMSDVSIAINDVVSDVSITIYDTISSIAYLKEQVKASKSDAVDFLAGEKASDLLSNTINNIRNQNEKLADVSDEEIAMVIARL